MAPRARLDWAKDLPSRSRSSAQDVEDARRGRLAVLGRLRRRLRGPRQEDHPRGGRAARHWPASRSPCSATARPAPATRPAAPATSSCSRCWPSRTSRRSTRPRSRRSSSPARTASTRSRTSTRSSAASYEVVHHTQLLNRLVREGRLTPGPPADGAGRRDQRTITYHDPCYLGRHNGSTPRRASCSTRCPGVELREMERNAREVLLLRRRRRPHVDGGEDRQRININRTEEAVATGADQIAVGCPFCRVMLSDGLTAAAGRRQGPRGGRGPRRRADAARRRAARDARRSGHGRRELLNVRGHRHRGPRQQSASAEMFPTFRTSAVHSSSRAELLSRDRATSAAA